MMTTVPFVGPFARDLRAFVDFKRALGRSYKRSHFRLRSFDRFSAQCAQQDGDIELEQVISLWLARLGHDRKPTTIHAEFSVVRQFCLFQRRRDPDSFVPGSDLAPPRRGARFLPYVFSVAGIRRVLRAIETTRCRGPDVSFRSMTFGTLVLVLFCTGLRFGEALRLGVGDVDLRRQMFFIANSKGRSRWVPFHKGLGRHLREYLQARSSIASADAPFFVKPTGEGYKYVSTVSLSFRRLFRRMGLKPSRGRHGPRPYDLRHSFAVNRLTRWYRDGVDLHAHLPWLSAYMGHSDLLGTERYLTATPELLQLASRRFAARLRRKEPT
jgi:integrase